MVNPPPPSRASPAPTGFSVVCKSPNTPQIFVGAELAREGIGSANIVGTDPPPSRASSAPTGFSVVPKIPNTPQIPVGASLLAIALGQATSLAQTLRFREQAHSYRVLWRTQICEHPTNPCGSGLAREGGGSGTIFGTDTPLSRAGSLLQGWCCLFDHFDKRLHPRTAFMLARQQQQRRYGTWLG